MGRARSNYQDDGKLWEGLEQCRYRFAEENEEVGNEAKVNEQSTREDEICGAQQDIRNEKEARRNIIIKPSFLIEVYFI